MPAVRRVRFRRGDAAEWASANPVLATAEPGVEEDTGLIKLGDGTRAWVSLPYVGTAPSSVTDASVAAGANIAQSKIFGLTAALATLGGADTTEAAARAAGDASEAAARAAADATKQAVDHHFTNPEKHGVTFDGVTDDTTAWNNIFALIQTGFLPSVIKCPPLVTTLILGQLVIPNDSNATHPRQRPITIDGQGPSWEGYMTGGPPIGGTIFDMRYNGAGTAKLLTTGAGLLTFKNATFFDGHTGGIGSAIPWFFTTNTTIKARHCAFMGSADRNQQTCDQDIFLLGGTGTSIGPTANAPFQGYGTNIEECYFDRIRQVAKIRTYGNSVFVRRNTVTFRCGSQDCASVTVTDGTTSVTSPNERTVTSATANFTSAMLGRPIDHANIPKGAVIKTIVDAQTVTMSIASTAAGSGLTLKIVDPTTTVPCIDVDSASNLGGIANHISENLIEVGGYPYAVRITNGSANLIGFNDFWDSTAATRMCIRFEVGATKNTALFNYVNGSGGMAQDARSPEVSGNDVRNYYPTPDGLGSTIQGHPTHFYSQPIIHAAAPGQAGVGLGFAGLGIAADTWLYRLAVGSLGTSGKFEALDDSKFGPATNRLNIGALGSGDVWLDATTGSTSPNVNLDVRAKGTGHVRLRSHLMFTSTAPAAAAVGANATSVGATGTDNCPRVTFTTAAGLAADASVVTVTWAAAFATTPGVIPSPIGAATKLADPYIVSRSTTTTVIGLRNPPAGAVAMAVDLVAIG